MSAPPAVAGNHTEMVKRQMPHRQRQRPERGHEIILMMMMMKII
jgi:hypothetical protein